MHTRSIQGQTLLSPKIWFGTYPSSIRVRFGNVWRPAEVLCYQSQSLPRFHLDSVGPTFHIYLDLVHHYPRGSQDSSYIVFINPTKSNRDCSVVLYPSFCDCSLVLFPSSISNLNKTILDLHLLCLLQVWFYFDHSVEASGVFHANYCSFKQT